MRSTAKGRTIDPRRKLCPLQRFLPAARKGRCTQGEGGGQAGKMGRGAHLADSRLCVGPNQVGNRDYLPFVHCKKSLSTSVHLFFGD